MKEIIKKYKNTVILVILALSFFIFSSTFNVLTQSPDYTKWSSPDEGANYYFAKNFSEGRGLAFFDPAAVIGDNMVMPRSFRSDFGYLKPVSFLGIIIVYGILGMIFGSSIIPFLTPLLAALGIIFFYLIIKKLFDERLALISAFLLASFPVYIYYSTRSMFHNVLFVVFLLIGIYLLLSSYSLAKRSLKINKWSIYSWISALSGGCFIGLALITRTSEALWILPALFIILIFYGRRIGLSKIILALAGILFAFIPSIYFNQLLYSAPFYGGYNEMNQSLDTISEAGVGLIKNLSQGSTQIRDFASSIYHNIFYFGFDKTQSLLMMQRYIWDMFPILSISFIIGFLILIIYNIPKVKRKYLSYFLIFIVISVILIFYYGSWQFNDNPNPNRFTIGNSYTRYWLPIYLMMMPLTSLFIVRLSEALSFTKLKNAKIWQQAAANGLQILVVFGFIALNLSFVLWGSEEGLLYLYYNTKIEKAYAYEVFSLTEKESVIITRYHDKYLFPERRVIMGQIPNEGIFQASTKLLKYYPVYYYNFSLREEDVRYLNERKLPDYSLQIEFLRKIGPDFSLYKLSLLSD